MWVAEPPLGGLGHPLRPRGGRTTPMAKGVVQPPTKKKKKKKKRNGFWLMGGGQTTPLGWSGGGRVAKGVVWPPPKGHKKKKKRFCLMGVAGPPP
jgi:hypothetical protein